MKCTEDNINIWCDICGVLGAAECLGEDTASLYAVDFDLYIGGIRVNSTNMDDITTAINDELGEEVATGKASYDMFTGTLTLDGFSYMGEGDGSAAITHSGIGGLNIHLKGANSVRLTDTKGVAIYSADRENGISITADSGGSLELSGMYSPCSGNLNHLGEGLKMWDRYGEEIGDDGDYTMDTYLYIAAESKGAAAETDLSIGGMTLTDAELCVDDGHGFDTGDGYAAYDPKSNTLTLKDYDLDFDEGESAISYEGTDTLNIRLIGENTVTNANENGSGLVAIEGSLTISGDGSLEVNGVNYGMYANGSITISGGTVIADGFIFGMCADGDITISGGKVEAYATTTGIGMNAEGSITISGGVTEAQGGGEDGRAFNKAPNIIFGWAAYNLSDTLIEDPEWTTLDGVTVKQNRMLPSTYPISVGDEYFVITGKDGDGNNTFNTIKGGNGTATLTVKDENTQAPVYTITLNNFTYSGLGSDGAAINLFASYADRTTTFNLVLEGDSKLTLMPSDFAKSYGLHTTKVDLINVSGTGSLTLVVDGDTYTDSKGMYIEGGDLIMKEGSITVVAGDASFDPDDPNDTGVSCGVFLDSGDLIMEGGSLTANGGSAGVESVGMITFSLDVSGNGSVTATSGDAEMQSIGVIACEIDINDSGELNGTGGKAEMMSVGMALDGGDLTVQGGKLNGKGGNAGYMSVGMLLEGGNLNVQGGSVKGKGGDATGTEYMPGVSAGIMADGDVTVTSGSVIGTGGEASDPYGAAEAEGNAANMQSNSVGIMALGGLIVTNGSVTASGGRVIGTENYPGMSIGIVAMDAVTMNGGTTVAQGETSAFMAAPTVSDTFENATVWYGASADAANAGDGTPASEIADTVVYTNNKYVRIAASGSEPPADTNYDVWVGGMQFTSDQLTIDGDKGTATLTVDATDSKNPVYTLKLNGYEFIGKGHEGSVIYSEVPLTIELVGENRVIGYDVNYGVNVEGNLTVTGTGALTAEGLTAAFNKIPNIDRGLAVYDKQENYVGDSDWSALKYARIAEAPATYTITFNANGGSFGLAGLTTITESYFYGSYVSVGTPIPTKTGYTFAGWDKEIPATMPAENMTITAKWTINQYTISFDSDGGTAIAPITQDYNTTVKKPADPTKTGYTFAGWDKEIPATMPAENITVTAQWTENKPATTDPCDGTSADNCPSLAFSDLNTTAWYHHNVDYVLNEGMMNGMGGEIFAPNGKLSRAMLVTILWRLEGKPVVNYPMTFKDVDAKSWYGKAVRWAASKGIVEGYSDKAFGPNDDITREQLATILYRYEQYKGGGSKGTGMFSKDYTDLADVSNWAYEALSWCSMNGIVNGKPGKILDPKGTATRAEAAAMLNRYCEKIDNK